MTPKAERGTDCWPVEGGRPDRGREFEIEGAERFIEAIVATAFTVPAAALRLDSRGPAPVAFARQVAMYLAHTRLGLPYLRAGAFFGRDRTTAAHACRRVEDSRENPRIDRILDLLERAIDLWPGLTELGRAAQ